MIPRECRRLAEVDFPIAAVSKHAVAEHGVRRAHPRVMHKWWARRPLASSRAMLLALLLPDPSDEHCPPAFRSAVRRVLIDAPKPVPWRLPTTSPEAKDELLRRALLGFIGDYADWANARNDRFQRATFALLRAAHGPSAPLVVDPFAGGGSIPLEALRLGCDAFASDLNPVSCLILNTTLVDSRKEGERTAEKVRKDAAEVETAIRASLRDLYPTPPDGTMPLAYLWTRTVRCEAPRCGAEVPLLRSFWLSRTRTRSVALKPVVSHGIGRPIVDLRVFAPRSVKDVRTGTVAGGNAICLACEEALPTGRVRAQLVEQRGGSDVRFDAAGTRLGGARLVAIVTLSPLGVARHYREPVGEDYLPVWRAMTSLRDKHGEDDTTEVGSGPRFSPFDQRTPKGGGTGAGRAFSLHRYGMYTWRDAFNARQRAMLLAVTDALDGKQVASCLPIGKIASHGNVFAKWHRGSETVARAFGMQTMPMSWDFPELVPFAGYAGGISDAFSDVAGALDQCAVGGSSESQIMLADAQAHPLPDASADVWFTDPPYYDHIPYADLADFFLVWFKRILPRHPLLVDPFDSTNPLSPKDGELVQDETRVADGRPKDARWFEEGMSRAFSEGRRVLKGSGVGCVVFAHKTTAGWEALLSGMVRGGWTITGSWPIATERHARLRARESAALATSVHLVCRPRPDDAAVGEWTAIVRRLVGHVEMWMERLQREGVQGADLVFACIGPALELYSRYRRVETVAGDRVELREYLEKVWEAVGRAALAQILGKSADQSGKDLEEDARLTALFLWTMQSTRADRGDHQKGKRKRGRGGAQAVKGEADGGGVRFALPFDLVRRFAQPMGISLEHWNDRIIEQEKGVVRLLPVAQRAKQIFGELGRPSESWDTGEGAPEQRFLDMDWSEVSRPVDSRGEAPAGRLDTASRVSRGTSLDRVHAAMLLQSDGRSEALRTLLAAEIARGPDFLRLANALSALYPRGSQERRLVDAMLLAVPR